MKNEIQMEIGVFIYTIYLVGVVCSGAGGVKEVVPCGGGRVPDFLSSRFYRDAVLLLPFLSVSIPHAG